MSNHLLVMMMIQVMIVTIIMLLIAKLCASVLATLSSKLLFAETFSVTRPARCACQNKLSPLVVDTYLAPDNIDWVRRAQPARFTSCSLPTHLTHSRSGRHRPAAP